MDEPYHLNCPICQLELPGNSYLFHMMTRHIDSLITMYSIYMPNSDIQIFLDIIQNYVDQYTANNDYDYLLQLCENLGSFKKGIQDIEKICHPIEVSQSEEKCPICLELFIEKENICRTNICKHDFCKPCLAIWLKENTSCPLCQGNLDIDLTSTN